MSNILIFVAGYAFGRLIFEPIGRNLWAKYLKGQEEHDVEV
jgi:hypothetical protein